MSIRLLVVGSGSQARYVLETMRQREDVDVVGLIDTFENQRMWGQRVDGASVLGGLAALDALEPSPQLRVVLAVSNVERKRELAHSLIRRGHQFFSVVHSRSTLASDVRMGVGCIINAGVTIERGSVIGDHAIIHAGCVIEHDNVLKDFVNLGPGVVTAGRVVIETGVTVFTGARVIPDVVIGEGAVVGAGAVLPKSVAPRSTVIGCPARELRRP